MKARNLIDRASFDPDQLKIIGQAFDGVWAQIAPSVGTRPNAIEAARLKLANCILGLAKRGVLNADQLTRDALAAMNAPPTELR